MSQLGQVMRALRHLENAGPDELARRLDRLEDLACAPVTDLHEGDCIGAVVHVGRRLVEFRQDRTPERLALLRQARSILAGEVAAADRAARPDPALAEAQEQANQVAAGWVADQEFAAFEFCHDELL